MTLGDYRVNLPAGRGLSLALCIGWFVKRPTKVLVLYEKANWLGTPCPLLSLLR